MSQSNIDMEKNKFIMIHHQRMDLETHMDAMAT